jgi:hypothetical protein
MNEPSVATTSTEALYGKTTAATTYSGLSAEIRHLAPPQEAALSHAKTSTYEAHSDVDIDDDALLQEILRHEEEVEADVQRLAASSGMEWDENLPTPPSEEDPAAEGLQLDCHDHAGDLVSESEASHTRSENDKLTASVVTGQTLAAEKITSDASQQPYEFDQHSIEPILSKAANSELTKPKNASKPHISYAEQVKQKKKDREQTAFVDSMRPNGIVSAKESGTTDAGRLKRRLDSGHPRRPAAAEPKRPQESRESQAAADLTRMRTERRERRVAADQRAHEAKVTAQGLVPTTNYFAASTVGSVGGHSIDSIRSCCEDHARQTNYDAGVI